MLTVEYTHKDARPIADGDAMDYAEKVISQFNDWDVGSVNYVATCNESVILAFQVLVLKDKIEKTNIRFLFEGQYIYYNERWILDSWPEGFADMTSTVCGELLTLRLKKVK